VHYGSICIAQEHKGIIIENLKGKAVATADGQSNTVNPENPIQVLAPGEKRQDCSQIYLQQDSASIASLMS
jgi:hypothetical protein